MNAEPANPLPPFQQTSLQRRDNRSGQAILWGAIALTLLVAMGMIALAVQDFAWQYIVTSAAFGVASLVGLLISTNLWKSTPESIGFPFIIASEVAFVVMAALFAPEGALPTAIIAFTFSIILGSTRLKGRFIEYSIFVGFAAAIASALLGNLNLLQQISNPLIYTILLVTAGLLIALLLILFVFRRVAASLRVQLLMGGLLLTIVPLAILALISNQFTQNEIQAQSNQSLTLAANQTAASIDSFFNSNLENIQTETRLPAIQRYLLLPPDQRAGTVEETELASTFASLQTKQKQYSPSYGLLNTSGVNLYDTDRTMRGASETSTEYFKYVQNTGLPYSTGVIFTQNTRDASLYFIAPVRDINNRIVGYLRTRYDALLLQSIIQANVGLIGPRSYPMLLDENGLRLADGYTPNLIYRTLVPLEPDKYYSLLGNLKLPSYIPADTAPTHETDLNNALSQYGTGTYFTVTLSSDSQPHTESATAVTLQSHPWKVVFLQEQTNLIAASNAQTRLSTLIATIIAAIVGVLLILISNSFTRPILQLTDTAEKVSAGDLTSEAKITARNEIGLLGNTFNSMTRQLKQLVDTLEFRVKERTEQLAQQNIALSYRSAQLKTVADVARNIVSIRDLETLLTSVTTLINERFAFYHVGIFLIDERGEYAVLRAANSEGGRRMLARQHKLRVGQTGIVGYVTQTGEPRIATDVGKDAVFFNNPDLPETRSEMALPLKVENSIIGALDVQSAESNAFTPEDVDLFTTLADQIAVAISNNQLYQETRSALADAQNLHRRYLNQEWTRQVSEPGNTSYRFTSAGLIPVNDSLPEIDTVLETSRPLFKSTSSPDNPGQRRSVMAVPINLRGETIGVIQLQEDGAEDYEWSEDELTTVKAVSDQVAQALENARLFEGTIKRAERERKVLEITGKMRSTNDPQQMLKVTLEELKRNLGVTDGQIIINLPDINQADPQTRPLSPATLK